MQQTELMIAVQDVEKSSVWYQTLLGCRSHHGSPRFDRLTSPDGKVVLLLHNWGADEHPSMGHAASSNQGNGLVLYFRVEDVTPYYTRAGEMQCRLQDTPHFNEIAHQTEFSLRDPDGYFLTFCQDVAVS